MRSPPDDAHKDGHHGQKRDAEHAGDKARHRQVFDGLVPSVYRASICSVTFMVPSSAAIEAPTRPAPRPRQTGPSSLTRERLTTVPT